MGRPYLDCRRLSAVIWQIEIELGACDFGFSEKVGGLATQDGVMMVISYSRNSALYSDNNKSGAGRNPSPFSTSQVTHTHSKARD